MLEVLHHRRSLQSSLGAFELDTLSRHPHMYHNLALLYVFYPPAQPLGLRLLTYHLGPYHYVLYLHMLQPRGVHPHVLHPDRLYLFARSLAFDAHAPALALHVLGRSFGPRVYGLPLLASPFGPFLVLYPVTVRALVPDYFHLWVLKHLLEYHLSGLRPLNISALVIQVHFDWYLFLHTRGLREMAVQDLPVLLELVFVAPPCLARLAPELSLTHPAYSSISLAPRSCALVSASIYLSLTS